MAKKTGYGMRLQRGNGASPEVFTTLEGCKNIAGPDQDHPLVDATDADSVSSAHATFARRGYTDDGKLTVTVNLVDGSVTQLAHEGDLESSAVTNYKVLDRAGATVGAFGGWIESFHRTRPQDTMMEATLTYQVDGTYTAS